MTCEMKDIQEALVLLSALTEYYIDPSRHEAERKVAGEMRERVQNMILTHYRVKG